MGKFIQNIKDWNKNITVYDIDDTLVYSTAEIEVHDKITGKNKKYTTLEFTKLDRHSKMHINFEGFEDVKHLLNGKLILKNVKKIQRDFKENRNIAIITGRSNKDNVKLFLKRLKVKVPNELIYTVTSDKNIDSKYEMASAKKLAFIDLIKKGYSHFTYYDDSTDNLKEVKSLETSHDVKIITILT